MMDATQIREQMKVVGSNGQPVGTVDRVEGNRIKLTKNDSPDGEHRYVELSEVSEIKNGEVCVSGNHTAHRQDQKSGQTKTGMTQNQNGGQPGQNQMERGDKQQMGQAGQEQKSGQNGEFGKHVGGPGKAQQMNQNGEIKPAVKGSANPGDKRG